MRRCFFYLNNSNRDKGVGGLQKSISIYKLFLELRFLKAFTGVRVLVHFCSLPAEGIPLSFSKIPLREDVCRDTWFFPLPEGPVVSLFSASGINLYGLSMTKNKFLTISPGMNT